MPLIDFAWFCQPASQGMVPRQEPSVSDWPLPGLPGKHLWMATGRTDHPITKGDAQRSTKNPRIKPLQRAPSNSHLYSWELPLPLQFLQHTVLRSGFVQHGELPWRFQVLNWLCGACRLNRWLNKACLNPRRCLFLFANKTAISLRTSDQTGCNVALHTRTTHYNCMCLLSLALMSWPWTKSLTQPFRPQALLAFRRGPCIKVGQADSLLQKLIKRASRPIAVSITSNFIKPSLVLVLSTCNRNTWIDFFYVPTFQKLDDGWPESVEEQGLLLLVLRHYITRQYIYMYIYIPVVPHKAVAEVSKIGNL